MNQIRRRVKISAVILKIRVIPKSSRNFIQKENDSLKVYLTKPAQDGLANKQLIDLLADYLNTKKYLIRIIKGQNSRIKLVEIDAPTGPSPK